MTPVPSIENFVLLFGLALFFGLAFEELNARGGPWRPGGIRTFPLLAFIGALLYLLEPTHALAFCAGTLVLGACLVVYYARHSGEKDAEGRPNVTLALPFANLLAYTLGPVALTMPPWIPVGVTVAVTLLLVEREQLHRFAWKLPVTEIITAGKFLILAGLIMPLLPAKSPFSFAAISPRQIWLAVLAVCTLSYASYLLQRYVIRRDGGLWIAALGGLYSSTATTVALARNAHADPATARNASTGIVLATAIMYVRLLLVIAVFNLTLAQHLAPFLLGLAAIALGLAWAVHTTSSAPRTGKHAETPTSNPLEFNAALIFAALYVVISLLSTWIGDKFGASGLLWLAGIVGFTDVDPFVLSLAQGGVATIPLTTAAAAILIAAASNNLLKAAYAAAFAGVKTSLGAAAALLGLAAASVALALAI
jgi:uncharacterized membrane protein (DUF4010 family)